MGTPWTAAGAPPNHCAPRARACRWPLAATIPPYQWQHVFVSITTTVGQAPSDDYYAVIPRRQAVLAARVVDPSGTGYSNIPIQIFGALSATLTTDNNGYALGLVPDGRYALRLRPVAPATTRLFRPSAAMVDVHGVAPVRFIGYNGVQVLRSTATALGDGTTALTMTVRAQNAVGMPYGGLRVVTTLTGPPAIACNVTPNLQGYLEPQVAGRGQWINAPLAQSLDGNGALQLQFLIGATPGTLRLSVRDGAVSAHDAWTARVTGTATVRVTPARWATSYPSRLAVRLYDARGHGKPAIVSWPQAIWQALHGNTVPFAVKQSNGLTIVPTSAADAVGSQMALLRFLARFVPLHALEIGPVAAAGANNWGVAIFVHNRFGQTRVTHMIDAVTLGAIEAAPSPTNLPAIPTLAGWTAAAGSPVVRQFADRTTLNGRTYYGGPALPLSDTLNTAFLTSCQTPAPIPQ